MRGNQKAGEHCTSEKESQTGCRHNFHGPILN
jgi:hypothetical protein